MAQWRQKPPGFAQGRAGTIGSPALSHLSAASGALCGMAYAWPAMRPQTPGVIRGIGELAYIRCAGRHPYVGSVQSTLPPSALAKSIKAREVPGTRHGDPSRHLVRAVSDLGSQDYVCVSGAVGMALSDLERVWRAWQALNMHDRARFLHLFREAYRQEREERLAANRRAAGEPVTASAFDRMTLAALDFDARLLEVRPGAETYVLRDPSRCVPSATRHGRSHSLGEVIGALAQPGFARARA